jgi:dipeptidase D
MEYGDWMLRVKSSLNLGILTSEFDKLTATFCIRSDSASQLSMMKSRLLCLAEQLGGSSSSSGEYAPWVALKESPFRNLILSVYRQQTGKEPVTAVMHGGVECGILAEKLPGLDAVSFGPDLEGIHTPDEKMSISSTQRVWNLVKEVLARSNV